MKLSIRGMNKSVFRQHGPSGLLKKGCSLALCLALSLNAVANDEKRVLEGIVINKSGEPLIGATVMSCGGCAGRVKKALLADKGVKDVTIDLAIQAVTVTYDDAQTNEANLLKDLEAGKYQGKVTTVEALKKAAEAKAAEAKKEGGCHGGGGCHKAGGNDKK